MRYTLLSSFLGISTFIGTVQAQNASAQQLSFFPEPLLYARIDPLVDPGDNRTSGHVCTVVGASNFGPSATRVDLLESDCTTVQVGNKVDLSAYWKPLLYHLSADGRFTALNMTGSSIYWNLYSSEQQLIPLPDDFNMVIGNATNVNGSCANGQGPGDGYFYSDFGNSYTIPQKYTSRLGTHIQFPDCWDGQSFTLQTQPEHTTFSDGPTTANCPEGYSRIPGLVISFAYSTGSEEDFPANPNGPTYLLSTGDSIGCSLHAAFINGFQTGAWEQIINECSHLGAGNTDKCSLLNITGPSIQAADACTYTQVIPDEDVGLVDSIPQLPGCISVGGVVAPNCPEVAFVPATNFVTTSLRQKGGLPIISPGSPIISSGSSSIPSTTAPSPTAPQNAGTTSSGPSSAITVTVHASNPPSTVAIVAGVVCGIVALAILGAMLWFFRQRGRQRDMMVRSAPLVASSSSNGSGNFSDYPIDKDVQKHGGGVSRPFQGAELSSPVPMSLDFKNQAFELPAVSPAPTLGKNFSSRGSQSDQEHVMSWDQYSR